MTCNATRIELSNAATTDVVFTVTPNPGSEVLTFQVDALGLDLSGTLVSGTVTLQVSAVSAEALDIYDATIQVGSNAAISADALVVESNTAQAVGVNVSGSDVTYCAPIAVPNVPDSYLMLIEEPEEKTYVVDVASVAQRTITAFRARTLAGSCDLTLKSNGGLATVGSVTASVTTGPTSAPTISNAGIVPGERIELEVTANNSAEDLQIVIDYTQ